MHQIEKNIQEGRKFTQTWFFMNVNSNSKTQQQFQPTAQTTTTWKDTVNKINILDTHIDGN
jgi:hypothetical protein